MKYWVFDLDGTLIDSLTTHFRIVNSVFSHYQVPFSHEDHHEVLRRSARTFPDYLKEKLGDENGEEALELFRVRSLESFREVQAFPGIRELLENLRASGAKTAVWTARDLEATHEILQQTELASFFDTVVSGTCGGNAKPNPEGLYTIATKFQCEAQDLIMVGDHEHDMTPAKAVGAKGVRVWWSRPDKTLSCTLADHEFHSVSALNDWLSGPSSSVSKS